jgi:hypothetical protein
VPDLGDPTSYLELVPDDLGDKLRRAWNRISGNY